MARTVLIVDDIEFVRKTLSAILTEAHFQVVGEAGDGARAVQLYDQLKPDVVTMDVALPGMSGIEATKQILKENPTANIVIITAMGQDTLIMDGISAGAKDYILKPFSTKEVLRAMERVIDGASAAPAGGLRSI